MEEGQYLLVALPRHKSSLTSRNPPTIPQNGSAPLLSKICEDKMRRAAGKLVRLVKESWASMGL